MPRVKGGSKTRNHHKKVLKQAEGYRNASSRSFYKAYEAVTRALNYAFRDRKAKKREFRALWVQRINAAARNNDLSYSQFVFGLKKNSIELNRKVLADIAISDPEAFKHLSETVKN